MPLWLYAVLCVVVPGVWGAAMVYAFDAWERRRARVQTRPPVDYSI